MAFYDDPEKQDLGWALIHNIISGKSNVDMVRALTPQSNDNQAVVPPPAAQKPTPPKSSMAPINLGFENPYKQTPQKQGEVVIEGEKPKPFELPDDVPVNTPELKIIKKTYNDYLEPKVQASQDLSSNLQDINKKVGGYESNMKDLLNKIGTTGDQRYTPDPSFQKQLDDAGKAAEGEELPHTDMLSQAILSLAPALFGSVTGEAGAISQQKAGPQARAVYDSIHKEDVDRVKLKNAIAEKRYEQLLKIKNSGQDAFTKAQQLEMDKLKAQISGNGDLLKAGVTDQSKTEENLAKNLDETGKGIAKAGDQAVAAIEKEKDRKSREKAAAIRPAMYGNNAQDARDERYHNETMRKVDKDPNMTKYRANYGNLEQARTKLTDPNVLKTPEILQDVQRLITTSMGATGASGIEERKVQNAVKGLGIDGTQLLGFLKTSPQAVNDQTRAQMTKFFTNLLNNEKFTVNAVIGNNMKALTSGHESMYDRRPDLRSDLMNKIKSYEDFAQSEIPAPQSADQGIKVINGAQYKQVNGGWQKVK